MLNAIPIVGWIISAIAAVSLSFPFWLCWTVFGTGEMFFDFLPPEWQSIGFLRCVALFISISIIKQVFVPKFVSVNNSSESKNG